VLCLNPLLSFIFSLLPSDLKQFLYYYHKHLGYCYDTNTAALAQGGCDRQKPKDQWSPVNPGVIRAWSGEILNLDEFLQKNHTVGHDWTCFPTRLLSHDMVDGYMRLMIEGYHNHLSFYCYTTYYHYHQEDYGYIRILSHPGIRLCCSLLVNYLGNGMI
jgi:hypothetical protein